MRPAVERDGASFSAWTVGTKDNLHDAEVLKYKGTVVWCAYESGGPVVFVPVQRPVMMEALAINPDSDPVNVAIALKELVQAIVTQCHIDGTGEIYFLCKEETTKKFAEKQAFEKLPWDMYRLKVADLEKPCESPQG